MDWKCISYPRILFLIQKLPAEAASCSAATPPELPSPATLSAILDPHDKPLIWTSDRHL